jgi:hypothetical protein
VKKNIIERKDFILGRDEEGKVIIIIIPSIFS